MSEAVAEILHSLWEKNYVANRARMKETEPFQYRAVAPFKPAMCVGAGPSLQGNVRYLDDDAYTVIACDKAVPALRKKGYVVDYVVALNAAHTDVASWLEPANDGETTLVCPAGVNPEAWQGWKGPVTFVNAVTSSGLHERVQAELGHLPVLIGSNAGTFAYTMAYCMGFNPIAYCAMDFSFVRKSDVKARVSDDQYNIVEMTDVRGQKRWLTLGWFYMADAFQDKVKDANMLGVTTVNCTEGGINYSDYCLRMSVTEFNNRLVNGWNAKERFSLPGPEL